MENEDLGISICGATDCETNVVGKTVSVVDAKCEDHYQASMAPPGVCTFSGEQFNLFPGVVISGECPEFVANCPCKYYISAGEPVQVCDCTGTMCPYNPRDFEVIP
jgi:hypothetical protein